MKNKLSIPSGFFNPRILAGFVLCTVGLLLGFIAVGVFSGSSVMAQKPKQPAKSTGKADVVKMVGPVSQDLDLRLLPYIPANSDNEVVRLMRHPLPQVTTGKSDPIRTVRGPSKVAAMPTPIVTYPGITSAQSGCGCLPPDTDGAVGPNNYIQAVNSSIKILDKSGNQLMAPTTYNSFFSALGTSNPCGNNNNDGDGITFYDRIADRWVVSDFAFPAFPGTSFYQCIGVSKTNNPVTGGWWLYAVQVDPSNPSYLGDYPKFGLWPDAYYMTVNLFSDGSTFNGVRVIALPRNDMINGVGAPTPNAIGFDISPATLGDAYSLVAANYGPGDAPPAGEAEYLLAVNSSSVAGTVENQVFAWRFHVDFTTPANSTLGVGANHAPNGTISVNGFVDAFTSTTSLIVPQTGTTRTLDTLGDKIMYPVVYQNLGGTESLWADQTVNNNQNSTGPTAIRWYQFNISGGTIPATPAQQETWNNGNDGLWRWMPSIAVDAQGNAAIGYSVSSSAINPAIKYAGRLASDPPNDLTQGEALMVQGAGHQTSSSGRWGDYSSLFVDPSDNATFWHTNEYYSATSSASWNTLIGTFKFPAGPVPVSAVSRKAHGAAGNFDIALPLTGSPGVEDRNGPTVGNHQVVVTFANPVTISSAAVTSGTGSVTSASASGNTVTVNLTGVTNAQTIYVTLVSVSDGTNTGNVAIPMAILLGDTNGDRSVNASDISQTKAQSGASVDGTNFREDVNTNGVINASDISLVKGQSGTGL